MQIAPGRLANDGCRASARSWQNEAQCLREQAEKSYLTPKQRASLVRSAEAAERQAAWWLSDLRPF